MLVLNLLMISLNFSIKNEEESMVKRTILNYGQKIPRLNIKDISEKSNIDTTTTLKVLKAMIEKEQIYSEYFKSSKSVAFNQIANVEHIDRLMKIYDDWEHERFKKV